MNAYDWDTEGERNAHLEIAEENLTAALRFLQAGRPSVAAYYTRLAAHRLNLVKQLDTEPQSVRG